MGIMQLWNITSMWETFWVWVSKYFPLMVGQCVAALPCLLCLARLGSLPGNLFIKHSSWIVCTKFVGWIYIGYSEHLFVESLDDLASCKYYSRISSSFLPPTYLVAKLSDLEEGRERMGFVPYWLSWCNLNLLECVWTHNISTVWKHLKFFMELG